MIFDNLQSGPLPRPLTIAVLEAANQKYGHEHRYASPFSWERMGFEVIPPNRNYILAHGICVQMEAEQVKLPVLQRITRFFRNVINGYYDWQGD
jgi:hypothetical protein